MGDTRIDHSNPNNSDLQQCTSADVISQPSDQVLNDDAILPLDSEPLLGDQGICVTLSPQQIEKLVIIKKILDQIETNGGISMFWQMWADMMYKLFSYPSVTQAAKIILQAIEDKNNQDGQYVKRFLKNYHLIEIKKHKKCSITNIKCNIDELVKDICSANSIDIVFKEII